MDQVRKLLDDDPGNSEYADMEKELAEVIFIQMALSCFPRIFLFFFFGKINPSRTLIYF